jgi:ATP-dependent Clp protease ATP-binding subunit ClpB
MTSNLGSQHLMRIDSLGEEAARAAVMDEVRKTFRPEFINRVDETLVFSPLTGAELRRIVSIQIERTRQRLAERGLTLELTLAAEQLIAERGFDPVYGARPLKRVIRQLVENPLAQAILAGEYQEGDGIRVDCDMTRSVLVFGKSAAGAPVVQEKVN